MNTKLKIAKQLYERGYTCSQAVFSAYVKEIGIDEETAYRIMEGFGGGIGGIAGGMRSPICGFCGHQLLLQQRHPGRQTGNIPYRQKSR